MCPRVSWASQQDREAPLPEQQGLAAGRTDSMNAFGIAIDKSCIHVFDASATKRVALDALIDIVSRHDGTDDVEQFKSAVYQREAIMSTGVGGGVAIPHVRFRGVRRATLGLGISKRGIDYGALDNEPVHIIVLFAMPVHSDKEYLDLLAQVMMSLKKTGFREKLIACATSEEVLEVLQEYTE